MQFSFDASLLSVFSQEERGVLQSHGVESSGKFVISQQQKYKVFISPFRVKAKLERKVKNSKVQLPVYEKRKNTAFKTPILGKHGTKKDTSASNRGYELSAYRVARTTPKMEVFRETVYLQSKPESRIKYGRFWWNVISFSFEPAGVAETIIVEGDAPIVGDLLGDKLVTEVIEQPSEINKLISRLCYLANKGGACISGQKHETVKTCHASRAAKQPEILSPAMFVQLRNKLAEITPMKPGDFSEEVVFDSQGNYVGRNLTVAADRRIAGRKEKDASNFVTKDLGVSEKYKPLSLPGDYREVSDKPDAPVLVDLSSAEKKLRALGLL